MLTEIALTGSLVGGGDLRMSNPKWLKIPDGLNWAGGWNVLGGYDKGDVVLYATEEGNYHAFVSKAGHNTGNVPPDEYTWWSRLVQPQWDSIK